jgi:O-antigen/teichoic acid export membrane protein
VVVVGLGFVATRLLTFVVGVVIARYSGVSSFGQFTLFTTVFVLVTELPNAIDITYIRFASASDARHTPGSYLTANILMKLLYMCILGAAALALLAFMSAGLAGESAESLLMIAWACAAGGIYSISLSLIARHLQRHAYGAVSILRPLFGLVILIIVLWIAFTRGEIDVTDLVKKYMITAIPFSALAVALLWRHMDFAARELIMAFRQYAIVASTLVVSSFMSLLANRLDVFFLTTYLTSEELGYYGAALRIIVFVSLLTSITTTILTPKAPLAWEGGASRKRYFIQSTYYFALQLLVAICLVVAMRPLVGTLFGEDYIGIVFAASLLVAQVLFTALGLPFQLIIQCSSRPRYMLYINIVRLLLGAVVLYFMVPSYGVVGAATGAALTSFLIAICTIMISMLLMSRSPVSGLTGK